MNILAVNPWIYDFAAYDFWLKPYGFLVILQYLKNQGVNIDYIDCLEHQEKPGPFGRGKYHAEIIEKPKIFSHIPRYYKRYGIPLEKFKQQFSANKPDYILITSSMTYWYPGINAVIEIMQQKFPQIPVIIGGTYATLCFNHAKKNIPCSYVFENKNLSEMFKLIGVPYDEHRLHITLPVYENFYQSLPHIVFRTSWGCPFSCSYCAIKKLFPLSLRLNWQDILCFIKHYAQAGHVDFVLYDDAFLTDQNYVKTLLNEIVRLNLNIRFHTPNALHLRYLDLEIAQLLKKAGFINPHFGLETLDSNLQKKWGDKVTRQDLLRGIGLLKTAGFAPGEFSAYLLLGYPGQNLSNLKEDVDFLHCQGAKTSFAEYSPVPGTEIFEQYHEKFDEPLLQNNSVFAAFQEDKFKEFWEIKNYLRGLNKKFE